MSDGARTASQLNALQADADRKAVIESAIAMREAQIGLARADYNECAEYVLRDEETGNRLHQAWLHEMWTEVRREHKRAIIIAHVEAGKGVALGTPVLTSRGWTTMGGLCVGDEVFDQDGAPTQVTAKSPVHNIPCFRITWTDGESMVFDHTHRWVAATADQRAKGTWLGADGKPKIVTTEEIYRRSLSRDRWATPVPQPVQLPAQDLPIDPWVLGVWLGDGNVASAGLTNGDQWIWDELERVVGTTPPVWNNQGAWVATIGPYGKFIKELRALKVLNNKHIPPAYMVGSIAQRRALLEGLLDTDGSVDYKGRVEFCQVRRHITEAVRELVWSLGVKCGPVAKKIVNGTPYWRISFRPHVPVFRVPRKLTNQKLDAITEKERGRAAWRTIKLIEPTDSVATQCITVDSSHSTYCVGRTQVVTHNSQQFSVGVPMYELGHNPRGRYAVVSRTQGQSLKSAITTAGYISRSEKLREVFPHLRPGPKWSEKGFYIERPDGIKEPSLAAFGIDGAVTGARMDGMIFDDVLDSTNTRTKARRDEVEGKFFAEFYSRLTEDAWCYLIGNAWDPDDLYHRLEARGWPTYRFPVMVTAELMKAFPQVGIPKAEGGYGLKIGDPTWPERWSHERIQERREVLPPIEFARSLMCVARDDKDSRFKREWIDLAYEKGADLGMCHTIHDFLAWDDPDYRDDELAAQSVVMALNPEDNTGAFWVFSGVDLSTGKSDDLSVITTIAVDRITKKRFLLDCASGRWQVDEILRRIKDVHARYGSIFIVENNATQDYIVQILHKTTAIPTVAHTTGRQKADPSTGIEVLAAELAAEKWIIPSMRGEGATEDIQELVADMLYYSPNPRDHTGDRLMSLWFAQVLASRMERAIARLDSGSAVTVI